MKYLFTILFFALLIMLILGFVAFVFIYGLIHIIVGVASVGILLI